MLSSAHLVQGEEHVDHLKGSSLVPLLSDGVRQQGEQVGVLQAAHDSHLLPRQGQLLCCGSQNLHTARTSCAGAAATHYQAAKLHSAGHPEAHAVQRAGRPGGKAWDCLIN